MEIWHKNSYLDLIWLIINYLCGKIVLNMKRFLILMTLFSVLGLGARPAFAQRFGAPEGMKNKIVVGGNVGAGYYGNALSVSLSPQVGYRLTRSLEVGTRLGYQMTYHTAYSAYGPYFDHFFTGSLYANYEIFAGLYAQVENETACCLVTGPNITSSKSLWFNSFLVGGGYRQYSGSRSYVFYDLMYDLSWDFMDAYNNPYSSPFIVRWGFCYALDGKKK